jgi:hypothetical protein
LEKLVLMYVLPMALLLYVALPCLRPTCVRPRAQENRYKSIFCSARERLAFGCTAGIIAV